MNNGAPVFQPPIVKHIQAQRVGIETQRFTRHAIGYVLRGKKLIYYGDVMHEVGRGDVFYLSAGNHYIENVPEDGKPFEQIMVFYSAEQLSKIISHLSMNHGLAFANDHSCEKCIGKSHVVCDGWNSIKSFFLNLNQSIKDGMFNNDPTAESLKMTELVYLVFSREDCCIKTKILDHTDQLKETFEQTMYKNIFNPISIDELAKQSNRSLTSFKKEFRKHFNEPPHKWFIRQRLMHSRHLLVSTSKSIQEIGAECNFPNTSHFIKLFRKEYNMTPATYRNCHNQKKTETEKVPEKV